MISPALEKQSQLAVWAGLARGAEDYELLVGHLPGMHDQLTHGNWANPPGFDLSGGENAGLDIAQIGRAWVSTSAIAAELQGVSAQLLNDPKSFDKNDSFQATAALLLNGVQEGVVYESLYRGMNVDNVTAEAIMADVTPGHEFTLPLSSFSEEQEVAEEFAGMRGNSVIITAYGTRGVPMSSYATNTQTRAEREVVTAGTFKVESITRTSDPPTGGGKHDIIEIEVRGGP